MNRRTLLTTAAVAVGGLVAGCSGLGNGNGNADTNGTAATATEPVGSATTGTTRTTGNPQTDTPRPTTTPEPGTTDESMETTEIRTETAEMPATETPATTAPTTTVNAMGTETNDTAIPIPDPPSTQDGMGVARVAFENGERVVVTGVITAENGCQEATLASAQSNGTKLVVTVGTERTTGTNVACTQALTPVEYRFSLTPDDTPESVSVVHATMAKRRTITTAERGG